MFFEGGWRGDGGDCGGCEDSIENMSVMFYLSVAVDPVYTHTVVVTSSSCFLN